MNDNTPEDSAEKVISYISRGNHAFIACDYPLAIESQIQPLLRTLSSYPVECIRGSKAQNRRDFAVQLVESCQRLVQAIAGRFQPSLTGIAPSLYEMMSAFRAADRQGFLILTDIDPVIRMQQNLDFEGPLRSVMQRQNDVAIVIAGSNKVINQMVGD